MQRRLFLKSALVGGALAPTPRIATAQSPRMTIKRVRFYHSPNPRPIFNQSTHVVEVETDQGIRGIGEGGTKETVEQCAGLLIGEDPSRIEHLWQLMYRGYFYPPAREKLHALGALDIALWDLKGKALGRARSRVAGRSDKRSHGMLLHWLPMEGKLPGDGPGLHGGRLQGFSHGGGGPG